MDSLLVFVMAVTLILRRYDFTTGMIDDEMGLWLSCSFHLLSLLTWTATACLGRDFLILRARLSLRIGS
jgi:hypothetical protein